MKCGSELAREEAGTSAEFFSGWNDVFASKLTPTRTILAARPAIPDAHPAIHAPLRCMASFKSLIIFCTPHSLARFPTCTNADNFRT
jgi:hypothetical protein